MNIYRNLNIVYFKQYEDRLIIKYSDGSCSSVPNKKENLLAIKSLIINGLRATEQSNKASYKVR